MRRPIPIAILVLSAIVLPACGGGTSAGRTAAGAAGFPPSPTSAPLAQPETINGIVVPPDPGDAKDATLAGVDTDHNGIRDEIDRWIATQYGNKPGALEAIRWSARVSQKLMLSNPSTKAQALAAIYESMDVGKCTGTKLSTEGVSWSQYFNEKMIRTYNTRERIDARKRIFALAGMIVRNVKETTITCPYPDDPNE